LPGVEKGKRDAQGRPFGTGSGLSSVAVDFCVRTMIRQGLAGLLVMTWFGWGEESAPPPGSCSQRVAL